MAEPDDHAEDAPESPRGSGMAQVDPSGAARYREADNRTMLNDLSGEVEVVKDRLGRVDARVDDNSRKLDDVLRKLSDITPKIDDVVGFVTHGVPHLATKEDMNQRPTRRQSIFDLIAFIGFVGAIVALTLHFAK